VLRQPGGLLHQLTAVRAGAGGDRQRHEAGRTFWGGWDVRGAALANLGRHADAAESYQEALDRNPPAAAVASIRHGLQTAQQLPAERRKAHGDYEADVLYSYDLAIELYEAVLATAEAEPVTVVDGALTHVAYLCHFKAAV